MKRKTNVSRLIFVIPFLILGVLMFSCNDNDNETTGPENAPPFAPSNPSPADNAVGISLVPTLTWQCSDPENSALLYDLYLGTHIDSLEITGQQLNANTFTTDTLEYETRYYWQVSAKDDQDHLTQSDIWSFTTTSTPNQAPNKPSNPNPAHEAVDITIAPTLTWQCSDPDNDQLSYDVYFGTDSLNLQTLSYNQSEASYNANSLELGTTYYWQIITRDNHNNQTDSDVWQFTTLAEINNSPEPPSNPTPANEANGISAFLTLAWECSDPDYDPLTYDVYLGAEGSDMVLVSQDQSAVNFVPKALDAQTTYRWQIVAKDDHGHQTESEVWGFTTFMPSEIAWCLVNSGEYTYGQNNQVLTVDYDYNIMKFEVTNWQYVEFMKEMLANGELYFDYGARGSYSAWGAFTGDHPFYPPDDYEFFRWLRNGKGIEWTGEEFRIPPGKENHPVSNVTWFGAWAFAEHYGWKVPTTFEWSKAARGNTGWDYAFGNEIDGGNANYYNSGDPYDLELDYNTTPVGYYNGENHDGFQTTDSPSPYGAYDMSGNVWEYTDTWVEESYFENCIIRGLSWVDYPPYFQVWAPSMFSPIYGADNVGFRCVGQVE